MPLMGSSGQATINRQLVDLADIVLAVFDTRLGTATEDDVSGTAEEVTRARLAGKPVHVWFSEEQLDRNVDRAQLAALDSFRTDLQRHGLLGSYRSLDDLATKVRSAIERDLDSFDHLDVVGERNPSAIPDSLKSLNEAMAMIGESAEPQAHLSVSFNFDSEPRQTSRGRWGAQMHNQRITVRNEGPGTAERLSMTLLPESEHQPPHMWDDGARPTLGPGDEFSWSVLLGKGSHFGVRVSLAWTEREQLMSQQQHLDFN